MEITVSGWRRLCGGMPAGSPWMGPDAERSGGAADARPRPIGGLGSAPAERLGDLPQVTGRYLGISLQVTRRYWSGSSQVNERYLERIAPPRGPSRWGCRKKPCCGRHGFPGKCGFFRGGRRKNRPPRPRLARGLHFLTSTTSGSFQAASCDSSALRSWRRSPRTRSSSSSVSAFPHVAQVFNLCEPFRSTGFPPVRTHT